MVKRLIYQSANFIKQKVKVLGHILSTEGIKASTKKKVDVKNIQMGITLKKYLFNLRSFLGEMQLDMI